ncbi:MAG: COR domain-containing protein, partial [Clostridiales bacterium]
IRLVNLQTLDLRSTQIKEIPETIIRLVNLQTLYLSSTQIKEIPETITKLVNLKNLDLSSTQIKEIPETIVRLVNLQTLDLSSTQIKEIPETITRLKKLKVLDISDTNINFFNYTLLKIKMPIFNRNRIDFANDNFWIYGYKYFFKKGRIYVKFHEIEIKGVYVNKLSFDNVPDEVIEQGRNFITDYLNTKKEITINEFKILLIGKGAVGKTSLLKCLKKEEFDEQEDTTHGISIRDYKFNYNKKEYESKIWDFGGQDIMHSTHKFFLSERCFYIVVLDGRQDDNVEYWLKHIKSFGGDSPILVVINKMDMYPNASLNEKYLINKYKNIKDFYKISCKKCENIDKVEEGIKKHLNSIENINIAWPESWLKVKNKLEKNSYNYISYENYEDYCIEFGMKNKETQNNLLRYLNDLGVICDFSNWKLKERKVLNPKWITIGVYKVITSEKIKINNGYLKVNDLDEIINKECKNEEFEKVFKNEGYNYNLSEQKYILDLMEDFELCYFVDKETILIPSSLNDSETEHEINKNDTLEYRYVYNFMSKSIIHRLIVRMKSYVDKKNVWSTGVVLKDRSNDVKALVKLDEEERTIYINIKGDFGRDLLANIRKEINEINDSLKDVSEGVEEFVIKDGSKISYKSILIHYQKGKYTILAENGNEYIVTELLGDIQSLDLLDRKIINVRGDLHMDEIKGNKINEVKGDSVGEDKVVISGNTGQVNYAKDNAKIEATMNVDNRSINLDGIDKEKLFEQLSKLEEAFAKNKMYKEAGEINEAIEEKNESKVIKFLKASGQKVLQIAETTGLPLVVEIVKNRLGICE